MILVVSASTHPEPQHMVAALQEVGLACLLATSASFARDEWPMRLARGLPLPVIREEILRRQLPEGIGAGSVLRAGYAGEIASLWSRRVRRDGTAAARALRRRDATFHRRVVAAVRHLDPEVVIAQQESAAGAFAAASPGAIRILSYPLAHHRWLRRELLAERRRNPDWAALISPADLGDEVRMGLLDSEVEQADTLVVGSTFVRDTCIEFGVPGSKIVICPLGASLPEPATGPSGVFSPTASFRVLFAGQVSQRKGVSYLLDAFAALGAPGSELAFVGPATAEAVARLAGRPGVRYHGPVPRRTLRKAQSECDVLVLPSLGEGFPLVVIEAMAAGAPVITTTSTFAQDVIDDGVNGFVIPPADADAIVERLQELHRDRTAAREMGRRAAERASAYTWRSYRERFRSTFTQITGLGSDAA